MTLRVGVDFHVFDGRYQGSRTHVIELFAALIDLSPEVEFYLFLANPKELIKVSPSFSKNHVHLIEMKKANPFVRLYLQLPKLARKYHLDWLHTQYIMPWPLPSHCRSAVTIHDVLFESHPQYFGRFFVFRSKLLMSLAAKCATHVFTVSEFSKKEIVSRYQVDPNKISVIYNGVDCERFYPSNDGLDVVSKYELNDKKYILSVGRLDPRKNHISLINAFSMACKNSDLSLVIIGQPDYQYADIFTAISDSCLSTRIKILSDISDEELPALYRHAAMFVFPALAEGFGMPLLEAMASGVPVISSNTTAMPEVVGNCGMTCDPQDIEQLASLITKVESAGEDGSIRSALERASMFSWSSAAKTVYDVYKSCIHK